MHNLFPLLALILSLAGTRLLIDHLKRKQIYDHPNERSNHTLPTPRGGGLIISLILALFAPFCGIPWYIMIGIAALAGISFLDDLRGLRVCTRLFVQCIVVSFSVIMLPHHLSLFQGWMPLILDRLVTIIAWLWFINLTNFMDGIDGITCMETISIAAGVLLLALIFGLPLTNYSLVIIATALGFLLYNWHPAKIFMGDVGSIPLGFVLGWLLIKIAGQDHLAPALIIPGYYLADSTITITRRLLSGKKIWEAHSEHFYQQAVRSGMPHDKVVLKIAKFNVCLIFLAVLSAFSASFTWLAVIAAIVLIGVLLKQLASPV